MKKHTPKIIAILLVLGLIGILATCKSKSKTELVKTNMTDLYLINLNDDGNLITGRLENTFDYDLKKVTVTFRFFDKNAKLIDKSIDLTTGLKSHQVFLVEAVVPENVEYETYDYVIDFE